MYMTSTLDQIPSWNFKADYVETCNCDYGCPCNFNGFPSNGFCRALVLFHIRSGNYGDTNLEGIDVICAFSWPKAIQKEMELVNYLYQKMQATNKETL
jgi:hypothetical protein